MMNPDPFLVLPVRGGCSSSGGSLKSLQGVWEFQDFSSSSYPHWSQFGVHPALIHCLGRMCFTVGDSELRLHLLHWWQLWSRHWNRLMFSELACLQVCMKLLCPKKLEALIPSHNFTKAETEPQRAVTSPTSSGEVITATEIEFMTSRPSPPPDYWHILPPKKTICHVIIEAYLCNTVSPCIKPLFFVSLTSLSMGNNNTSLLQRGGENNWTQGSAVCMYGSEHLASINTYIWRLYY